MQKKLIALAVAGLMAAPAFAQSNVTIYGRIDYGFMNRSGDDGAVPTRQGKSEMESGIQGGSRLGFKGAEDLGNGLKAIFELEFGSISMDTNGGLGTNRHAWIGLTGDFGTVIGGRLDGVRYGIYNTYDPFGGGNVGNFTQMTAQVDRANNAIAYVSPTFGGFTGVVAYSTATNTDEAAGNRPTALDGDWRLNTLNLKYANGPIKADIDWEKVYQQSTDLEAVVMTLGASYDFGVVKLSALYDVLKGQDQAGDDVDDIRTWLIGAKAPIGSNVVLKAVYGKTKQKEDGGSGTIFSQCTAGEKCDAKKWGIGVDYLLSKRTNFYASYGSISNDRDAAYELSPAANSGGAGYGTRGFDLGIAHKF